MGSLRCSRLQFGIKNARHIFQRAIKKILGKVDNLIYQDDICLAARTREELKSKTEQDLRRLKKDRTRLYRKKMQPILAHANQFRARFELEDVEIPEKEHEKTEEENKTKHGGRWE